MLRKGNYLRIRTLLPWSRNKYLQKRNDERHSFIYGLVGYSGLNNTTTASDDNPFSGPKAATPGKVSVQMPTEDWLCKKIAKLNLTLVEGYPSRSSEAGGLLTDQFLRTAKSQSKWYGLSSDHKADPEAVSCWSVEASKLNRCYSRIARQSGLTSTHPPPPPPTPHPPPHTHTPPPLLPDAFLTNQVDFRSPPVKSVADFLMYLFEGKKLQPSTIDGYRSAIADKLGNTTVNISKDDNLTHLLESFHRDRPKGRRGIPSWNLSLVLHQLTKAPFEPLREASLKHLTFKTVFLLALGSGKRRSEIHAWQHKNIRHQSSWSKVSLFPSPSFLSKNQLAKEGPESVAPVVIPALAPTLDKSLKSDRSLCPVRALRYYLDRTSDLSQHKELVFVSFKKGFDKDISPATISSWIKQTVILCYDLSDHQAHTLHQVKAHDVRAFAASKAFQSGVSLEQILSACHWKSHNTFTQFYLKDVAWADSELFHLGPVVAPQQIHQQTRA